MFQRQKKKTELLKSIGPGDRQTDRHETSNNKYQEEEASRKTMKIQSVAGVAAVGLTAVQGRVLQANNAHLCAYYNVQVPSDKACQADCSQAGEFSNLTAGSSCNAGGTQISLLCSNNDIGYVNQGLQTDAGAIPDGLVPCPGTPKFTEPKSKEESATETGTVTETDTHSESGSVTGGAESICFIKDTRDGDCSKFPANSFKLDNGVQADPNTYCGSADFEELFGCDTSASQICYQDANGNAINTPYPECSNFPSPGQTSHLRPFSPTSGAVAMTSSILFAVVAMVTFF